MRTATLVDTRKALAEAEEMAGIVGAHPTPAGAEALRVAADRVLAAASVWARAEERPARSLAEARKICKAASALRNVAEGIRSVASLARLGTVSVG